MATRLGAVGALGVARGDDGVVEEAEAHRPVGLGVVARRPHGAEGVGDPARHHLVDREAGGAGGARGGLEALRRQRRCRRRAGRCPRPGSPRGSPRHRPRHGRWRALPRRPHGAPRRDRARRSAAADSACSIARSRSGRSGWPGGTRCSRKTGSVTRRVVKTGLGLRSQARNHADQRLWSRIGLQGVARRRRAQELGEAVRLQVDPRQDLAPVAAQQPPCQRTASGGFAASAWAAANADRLDVAGGDDAVDQPDMHAPCCASNCSPMTRSSKAR